MRITARHALVGIAMLGAFFSAEAKRIKLSSELLASIGQAERIGLQLYEEYSSKRQYSEEDTALRSKAVSLAKASVIDYCDATYEAVVLNTPEAGVEGLSVYLIGFPKQADAIMFGRHYRVAVDATATKVLFVQQFTKTCVTVPTADPAWPKGVTAKEVGITHMLSSSPNEIHVFLSLFSHKAFTVITDPYVWQVSNGIIMVQMKLS